MNLNLNDKVLDNHNNYYLSILEKLDTIYLFSESESIQYKTRLASCINNIQSYYHSGFITLHEMSILLSVTQMVISKWRCMGGDWNE